MHPPQIGEAASGCGPTPPPPRKPNAPNSTPSSTPCAPATPSCGDSADSAVFLPHLIEMVTTLGECGDPVPLAHREGFETTTAGGESCSTSWPPSRRWTSAPASVGSRLKVRLFVVCPGGLWSVLINCSASTSHGSFDFFSACAGCRRVLVGGPEDLCGQLDGVGVDRCVGEAVVIGLDAEIVVAGL